MQILFLKLLVGLFRSPSKNYMFFENHDFFFLNLHIFLVFDRDHYSRSSESQDCVFYLQKSFLSFGAKFENLTIFRRNFEKFQELG